MRVFGSLLMAVTLAIGLSQPTLAQQTAPNSQQEKMKTCNTDATAKKLTGDARKSFMSDCLKAKPATTLNSQQEKMKTCNAQASEKKLAGDPRRKFLSECLKSP